MGGGGSRQMEGWGNLRSLWVTNTCWVPIIGKALCWVLPAHSYTSLCPAPTLPGMKLVQWVQVENDPALAAGQCTQTHSLELSSRVEML